MSGRRSVAAPLAAALALCGAFAGDAAALFAGSGPVGANAFATDTLDPPADLDALGGAVVTLTWTPTPDAYATGYRVFRSTSAGGPYALVATVTPRTTTGVDDQPGSGTFFYVVESFSGGWTSARSDEVSALAL